MIRGRLCPADPHGSANALICRDFSRQIGLGAQHNHIVHFAIPTNRRWQMSAKRRIFMLKDDPGNYLAGVVEPFRSRLQAGRYSPRTVELYCACVFHFGEWLQSEAVSIATISERHAEQFLQEHIPACTCSRHVRGHLHHNRSALNHLLRVMRDLGIAEAIQPDIIGCEITAFDTALRDVWGLAPSTRAQHRRCSVTVISTRHRSVPALSVSSCSARKPAVWALSVPYRALFVAIFVIDGSWGMTSPSR